MKIQNMFVDDINRNINGVVKVTQDDNEFLAQELKEYVVTKELKNISLHFSPIIVSPLMCLPVKSVYGFQASLVVVNLIF